MKATLYFSLLMATIGLAANAQCNYIPSTSTATDTLSYSFSGGSFQSWGCAPLDPTYWLSGSGNTATITFVNPESFPSFRVWGMNDDDAASVSVNGVSYPLNSSTASYDAKVVCGLSPGPDGIAFSGGNIVGVNNNTLGNYSYQNVQLITSNVTTITITGVSGAGWGFAGASVNCPLTDISKLNTNSKQLYIYPNPFNAFATLQLNATVTDADISIHNLYGQRLKTIRNFSGTTVNLYRDNLPNGLYFIEVINNNGIIRTAGFVIRD